MLSLPNNRASYLINEGKSVQKLVYRTISYSTYLFNIQSGFCNIHSTSTQTTYSPASAGNRAGKVKKKKKIEEKKAGAEIFASAASLPVSTRPL